MNSVDFILAEAAARIGYRPTVDDADLPGSEAGRYLADKLGQPWLAGPSTTIWWCMCFVSMILDKAGQAAAIGGMTYNTDVCIRNAERVGCEFVSVYDAQPGDIVIFNWDGGGTDHVGIVEANLGGGWLQTIEGNTSPDNGGSQSAGNGVWRRQRQWGIHCVIRPNYTDASYRIEPLVTEDEVRNIVLEEDSFPGPYTIGKWQMIMGTPVDGVVSSQGITDRENVPGYCEANWEYLPDWEAEGSSLIEAVQRKLGIEPDGLAGEEFVGALQKHLGVEVDHYAGPVTFTALQKRLNTGTF